MKKWILLAVLWAPALCARPAFGVVPGVDMGWFGSTSASTCPASPVSIVDVTDPCDENSHVYGFAMSFAAPTGISLLVGETFFVDVETAAPVLQDWWHLEDRYDPLGIPRGCRAADPTAGVASSFGFSTDRGIASTVLCKDYWQGAQPGSLIWQAGVPGPARTRLVGTFARPVSTAGPLTAGINYYIGTGYFDTNHAVADPNAIPPTSSCAGCQLGACLGITYLLLQQPAGTPGGDVVITAQHNRRYMTWQGGVGTECFYYDPVRRSTWGQVKSLYR